VRCYTFSCASKIRNEKNIFKARIKNGIKTKLSNFNAMLDKDFSTNYCKIIYSFKKIIKSTI